jgi:GDP-L-fucose synthase
MLVNSISLLNQKSRIYIAGTDTLVGTALIRLLKKKGYVNLCGYPVEPDLTDVQAVDQFFSEMRPEYVFLVAGRTGGIAANQKYPADLMVNNLLIATSVIQSAHKYGVQKLLYLASSCSYPKHSAQPMQVDSLLTGPLESTNESYAVAKIAGIKLCEAYRRQYGTNFITAIPANPFGTDDDFDLEEAHVISALIHRMHQAKLRNLPGVEIWGTGTARREFIFADDLADACLFTMLHYNDIEPINLGTGDTVSIRELAEIIRTTIGYTGEIQFDPSKPDGMPIKTLDSTVLRDLGWSASTSLQAALERTYDWFVATHNETVSP